MLEIIASKHDVDASFWDLPSYFYTRNLDLEEVLCIPYTETRKGNVIGKVAWSHDTHNPRRMCQLALEISYTMKYPEYKAAEQEWVIRHSGVWHRFDVQTSQSTFVLFSPTPKSSGHQKAKEWLLNSENRNDSEPFWLHRLLFASYQPAWRQYIGALERKFLPIANSTFASFIDEPLRVGYDNLSALVSLETRFLQIPTILENVQGTLGELGVLLGSMSAAVAEHPGTMQLKNCERRCISYSKTATHLRERCNATARLLADTLSFRDQVVAKEQNGNMMQLNKSAVFITTLSLLYLPASFVAVSVFTPHRQTWFAANILFETVVLWNELLRL